MLRWRLLFGTLIIAALVLWCWLDANVTRPGAFLLPLALMLSWFGTEELLAMLNKRGRFPLAWVVYTGVLLTVLLSGLPIAWRGVVDLYAIGVLGWVAIGLICSLILAFIGELSRYGGQWHSTLNIGLAMLVITYIGGLMAFIVHLRLLGYDSDNARTGMLALVSLIATVKMSDIGQYTVGRLIGRHKLAPVVSPGKTWEGAVGGLVFAIGTVWFLFGWGARQMVDAADSSTPLNQTVLGCIRIILFAIIVATAGLLGDLSESMLKRDAGVKDSSTWMPGFGGILDLLDSILFAAPVVYLFWVLGIVRL